MLRDEGGKALRATGLGGATVAYELAAESRGDRSVSGRLPSLLCGSYSLNYASPPDPRDDTHALGVIAYQMLTGKLDAAPSRRFERELKELVAALDELTPTPVLGERRAVSPPVLPLANQEPADARRSPSDRSVRGVVPAGPAAFPVVNPDPGGARGFASGDRYTTWQIRLATFPPSRPRGFPCRSK